MANLWLDDRRPAPEGWEHARTVGEAQEIVNRGGVEAMSLDHDLGPKGTPSGQDFARWAMENGGVPYNTTIHSANPWGASQMRRALGLSRNRVAPLPQPPAQGGDMVSSDAGSMPVGQPAPQPTSAPGHPALSEAYKQAVRSTQELLGPDSPFQYNPSTNSWGPKPGVMSIDPQQSATFSQAWAKATKAPQSMPAPVVTAPAASGGAGDIFSPDANQRQADLARMRDAGMGQDPRGGASNSPPPVVTTPTAGSSAPPPAQSTPTVPPQGTPMTTGQRDPYIQAQQYQQVNAAAPAVVPPAQPRPAPLRPAWEQQAAIAGQVHAQGQPGTLPPLPATATNPYPQATASPYQKPITMGQAYQQQQQQQYNFAPGSTTVQGNPQSTAQAQGGATGVPTGGTNPVTGGINTSTNTLTGGTGFTTNNPYAGKPQPTGGPAQPPFNPTLTSGLTATTQPQTIPTPPPPPPTTTPPRPLPGVTTNNPFRR